VNPVLQAQDGSFVGTVTDSQYNNYMIAFDAGGNLRWTVANDTPQIATSDGGVIGASGITYDAGGNATGQSDNSITESWTVNEYKIGSVDKWVAKALNVAKSFWPFASGNPSRNRTAVPQPWYAPLQSCPGASTPCPQEAIMSALAYLRTLLQSPCSACTTQVLKYLPGTSQAGFLDYVSLTPRFFDGSRSYAPSNKALCPSGFFNQFFCSFGTETVHAYMQRTESEAVSQTPSDRYKGMQVFFDMVDAPCNVLSSPAPRPGDKGVLNQALLFHEAIHGYTGLMDMSLQSAFPGLTIGGPSTNITDYLELNVIPGGARGAAVCGNGN
jgi:hypothetical protein